MRNEVRYTSYDIEFESQEQKMTFETVLDMITNDVPGYYVIPRMRLFKCTYHLNRIFGMEFDFWPMSDIDRDSMMKAYSYVYQKKNDANGTTCSNRWPNEYDRINSHNSLIIMSESKLKIQDYASNGLLKCHRFLVE
jgi:hypothetical protein